MSYSRRQLEAMGEPLGESVTRKIGGRMIYGGGGGGDSGGSGNSVTTQEIPAELKPLATAYTNKAIKIADTPFQSYTGQRYADLNPTQNASITMTANRALNGSPTMNNATANLNQMMRGGPNPYLDAMVGRAQDSVIQGYNNANVSSGSFGNSGIQESLAKGLGDVSTSMYGGAYAQDQQNRLQALQMAPTFANQSYIDANQLMSAGQVMQDQSQQNKDFQYEEFMRNINKPYTDLAAMSGVFGSNLGGVSKTTSEQSSGGGGK